MSFFSRLRVAFTAPAEDIAAMAKKLAATVEADVKVVETPVAKLVNDVLHPAAKSDVAKAAADLKAAFAAAQADLADKVAKVTAFVQAAEADAAAAREVLRSVPQPVQPAAMPAH